MRLELLDALAGRLDLLLHEERALGLELALLGLRANRAVAPERSWKLRVRLSSRLRMRSADASPSAANCVAIPEHAPRGMCQSSVDVNTLTSSPTEIAKSPRLDEHASTRA